MTIKVNHIPDAELKQKFSPEDEEGLGFGRIFTDRMLLMEYRDDNWLDPVIKKYEPISLYPSAICLHYAQSIFEGMKAFRTEEGHINLFRPEKNAARFNRSAERMMMPRIDSEIFLNGIKELVKFEKEWAPKSSGSSLYIRPTMIGTEPQLGVRPSKEYIFYIILSPSGPYFPEGFNPIKIYVSEHYIRAAPGGTGNVKTGGNYGASILVGDEALKYGCSQVLWLDAIYKKYVEEVGAMNIFFVYNDEIFTAPLTSGTILPGVTRESIIQLAMDLGYTVREKALAIDDIVKGIHNGKVSEIFGSGTAASIAPVGSLYCQNQEHVVNYFKTGEISEILHTEINDIQYGRKQDPYSWIVQII
ncbi:MAG: branched-chain amino acid aminotransferase [Candidatus Hodarchaeales archaeon]